MNRISIHVPSEDEMKDTLREFFQKNGFAVEDIPESNGKRADFLICDHSTKALLELKIKGEDEMELSERNGILDSGEVYIRSESSLRRNRLSGLIKKGVSQLMETPLENDFRILWLHGAERYGEHHETRMVATLYGRRFLVHTEKKRKDKWCYYFDNSEFYRYREQLTAAVLTESQLGGAVFAVVQGNAEYPCRRIPG